MFAAGGTGGHLFPAFALAEELGRRGIAVDLITDMRGDRYGTGFPARKVYQVPSATPAGSSPMATAKAAATVLPRASLHELPAGSVPWGDREVLRGLVSGFLG